MEEVTDFGAVEIVLSDEMLVNIGKATTYESFAKMSLSLSYKAMKSLSHSDWVIKDKRQFSDIVELLDKEIEADSRIAPYFDAIKRNHERWRESRNFVVHSVWGKNSAGEAIAYCYRRKKMGDENDIVSAVNDSYWLSKKARRFQYEIALMISEGLIAETDGKGAGVSMKTPTKIVRF